MSDTQASATYFPSTRLIAASAVTFVLSDVGRTVTFDDLDSVSRYTGVIEAVASTVSATLEESDALPSATISITNIIISDMPVLPSDCALVTLADVKAFMGMSETTHDNMLQSLINDVSSNIEDECNCMFKARIVADEILDGSGRNFIYTEMAPILGPATDGDWSADVLVRVDMASAWETLESEKAYIYVSSHEPFRICLARTYFPVGIQNVKVSYRAGYTTIPADIRQMAIERVAARWDDSKAGGGRLGIHSISASQNSGSNGVTYRDLTDRWNTIVTQYRRAL